MTSAHGVLLLVVSESLSPPGYNGGGGPCGSQKRKSICDNCQGVVLFGCLSVLIQGVVGLGSEALGFRPRRGAGLICQVLAGRIVCAPAEREPQ